MKLFFISDIHGSASCLETALGQGKRIFLTHGHHFGPEQLPKLRPGDVFISGHTHIPLIDRKENILVLNPGSVSLPKEGHPRTFAVLEENRFTIWTLDGKRYMETALSGTDI